MRAAELVLVNVQDGAVAEKLLWAAGPALAGRTVVNLTDGPSEQAGVAADLVTGLSADYLHGQIMTIAPAIGSPDAVADTRLLPATHALLHVTTTDDERGWLCDVGFGSGMLDGLTLHTNYPDGTGETRTVRSSDIPRLLTEIFDIETDAADAAKLVNHLDTGQLQ